MAGKRITVGERRILNLRRSTKLALWALGALSLTAILAHGQSTDLHWLHPVPQGEQPAPRTDATILDDSPGSFLLFGGLAESPRNDLWSYSLYHNTWTELNPSGPRPPERFGHAVFNDIVARIMFVFGGQGLDSTVLNDVWGYDYRRNRWIEFTPEGPAPAPRYGHIAIDDFRFGRIISHGITDSGEVDDTWKYSGSGWTEISPAAVRPPARGFASAGVDITDLTTKMFLFGGCAPNFGLCPLGDFWSFDFTTNFWTAHPAGPLPPARQRSSLVSDTSLLGGHLILFGGTGESGLLADTWLYTPENDAWTQLSPGGTPPSPRTGHAGTSSGTYPAVFFGGSTSDGLSNEVWILAPPAGPVVNAASFQTNELVSGSIVSLFGTDLATETIAAVGLPLPTRLGDTVIQVNGDRAPLFYVSPTQINFQVPWNVARHTLAAVSLGRQSVATVPVVSASPGIFTVDHNGEGQGAVLIAGTDRHAAPFGTGLGGRPVRRGEYLEIYATGLGAVDNEPRSGSLAPADPLSRTIANSSVTIGGVPVEVTFSGLAPGQVGLYQVNALVPDDAPDGDAVPLVLSIEGAVSNTVTIAVQ